MAQMTFYFSKMVQIFEKIEILDNKITYIFKFFHVFNLNTLNYVSSKILVALGPGPVELAG